MNNKKWHDWTRVVRSILALTVVAATIAAVPSRADAQANIVANGGFESPKITKNLVTLPAASTTLAPSWTIGGDSIDLIGSFWVAAEGVQSIDLDGNGPGSISQTLTPPAAGTYRLQFKYSGHPNLGGNSAKATVQLGTQSWQIVYSGSSTKSNMGWITYTQYVPLASAPTVLSFTSNDNKNNQYGVALDDVIVNLVASQAPLTLSVTPGTIVYGATGAATVSGGSTNGAVAYSAAGGCTVGASTGIVTATSGTGTCTITATMAGDASFAPVTSNSVTVNLARADQAALTVTGPASITFGTTGTVSTTGGSGSGAVTYGASGPCTVDANTGVVAVSSGTGTCTITASKAADANYDATPTPLPQLAIALSKATQDPVANRVIVTGPASVTYPATGTATASGGSGTGAYQFSIGSSTGCSLSGTTISVVNVAGTCDLTATRDGDANYLPSAQSASFPVTLQAPSLATPVLIRAVATSDSTGYLIGQVVGAVSLPITLQIYVSDTCTSGVLGAPAGPAVSPMTVTTDANGYFLTSEFAVTRNWFVAAAVTSPVLTATSACMVSSYDNDTWPRAFPLTDAPLTSTADYIDAPGHARWYKFKVLPGQRIQVALSGLPADYDLVVFKDIKAQFEEILGGTPTAQITRLSAEYAPMAISPMAISPMAISPWAISPDAYSDAAFASLAFAAGVYSPMAISPWAISPWAISPTSLSPMAISPWAISPMALSPMAISPMAISPWAISGINATSAEVAAAYSSAQTRSIVGASMTPGPGDELVIVNSWNNPGNYYVRVAGRNGAYSTAAPFRVEVQKGETGCPANLDTVISTRDSAGASVQAVFVWDKSRFASRYPDDVAALETRLQSFAASVGGVLRDVNADAAAVAKRNQADANKACAFAKNLLALEIKGIVDSYRASSGAALRYVVLVGNDDVIPFFRYPDQSMLGEESGYVPPVDDLSASQASLRGDFVLSQDAYGSGAMISMRDDRFPVPGLAVGRLVESPADITGLLDAYAATGGVVKPKSSLVTGYDFLADAADAVAGEFATGGIPSASADTLIARNGISPQDPGSWTATQLGNKLLGSKKNDLVFLAGHFSANGALAADFSTSLLTTDLQASTTDFTNSIVFSAGCHSGYNIADGDVLRIGGQLVTQPLDWAQAFAGKKATLIAGTGYQYGDTDFLEYSERLYANFARQLRKGLPGTAVSVGEALVKAKLDYLATTLEIRGIHEKALLEATLFGLPMMGVNMAAGRDTAPPTASGGVITPTAVTFPIPSANLGLSTYDLAVTSGDLNLPATPQAVTLRKATADCIGLTNAAVASDTSGNCVTIATYLTGPNGIVSNLLEPVLPLYVRDVTSTVTGTSGAPIPAPVLRGVGFRGGSFTESTVTPLTGAATNDLRSVHVPFVSPVYMPMRMAAANYVGALAGTGGTSLLITPVQHRADSIAAGTSTQRKYGNLNLRLYYSSNAADSALSDNPTIVSVNAMPSADKTSVRFTAMVVGDPAAGIHEVWVTYVGDTTATHSGTWTSLDLRQCVLRSSTDALASGCGGIEDTRIWTADLDLAAANVTAESLRFTIQAANGNGGLTYDDNRGLYFRVGGGEPAATSLAFIVPTPAIVKFGDNVNVKVQLTPPAAGKSVVVAIGAAIRAGTTDASGQVALVVPAVTLPGKYKVVASFSGDDAYLSSAVVVPITITKTTSALSALQLTSAGTTTLTAMLGATVQPLILQPVRFTLQQGSTVVKTVYVTTDYLGRATLPPTGLPASSYTLTAYFDGNSTYAAAAPVSQGLTVAAQTVDFDSIGLPATIAYPGSVTFTLATTAQGQPVTVALNPASSTVCSLTGAGPTYTLQALAPGTCTLIVTANGTVTLADLVVTKDVTITKGAQSIAFATLADRTYGDAPFTVSATGGASGNPVTFSAQAPAAGMPATCSVSGNVVTILNVGTCTVVASQAGNDFYNNAPSVAQSFKVDPRAVAITADAKSKAYGSADPALTFTVTGGALVAGDAFIGTLTRVAGENVGSYAILQGSVALGSNYVLGYVGANLTIGQAATTTTVTVANATYDGSPHGGTASVTGPGGLNQSLTVTYTGTGATSYAASTTAPTNAGSYLASASYAGTTNYLGSSDSKPFTIAVATTATTLAASASSVVYGQSVTLTATVTAAGGGTPAGSVTFKDGTTTLGTATIGSGTAVYLANTLAAGVHTLTAIYAGNANDAGSTSASVTVTVAKVATTTALTADKSAAGFGQTVNLTATVAPSTATGTVTFLDGATALGTGTLDSSGKATFATSTLATGTHTLTASYGGDVNSSYSVSLPITVTINAVFNATGAMAQTRSDHTATLLNDGRVMVAGGFDATGASTATTEVYCPTSMPAPTVSLCQNGTGKFSTIGSLPSKSAGHTATLLANGKVLATGGGNSSAELFDPTTNSWSTLSGFASVRSYHTATRLSNGNVLFTGGAGNSGKTLNTTLIYNAATGTFITGPNMTAARERHTATLLSNGKVLIAGGRAAGGTSTDPDDLKYSVLNTAEVYDPATNTFTPTPVMKAAHDSHGAALLATGKVLVAGGGNGTTTGATAELFDPAANAWVATGPMQTARRGHSFTVLTNGTVLAAGGRNPTDGHLNSAELYNPAVGTFQPASSMTTYRTRHTATVLPDGYVLVTGGSGGATAAGTTAVNSAELYGAPAP